MSRYIDIFIDGGYFDQICRQADFTSVNFAKLTSYIAESQDCVLHRAYYYHCLPYVSRNEPTEEQVQRRDNKAGFFRALNKIPRFQVREGSLEYRGDTAAGSPIFIQKRVDIFLAVDLLKSACKGRVSVAALLTGDSDYVPVVTEAKEEGMLTVLYHGVQPHLPHRALQEAVDENFLITPYLLRHFTME